MRSIINSSLIIVIIATLGSWFASCKREYSCENCAAIYKPPVAIAGNDTTVTLSTDLIFLNGTLSYDPDGTITIYKWSKIAGPAGLNMVDSSVAKTGIKNVQPGVYSFELKVTDNDGLAAKDTVIITITSPLNRPPIANAGPDQQIIQPLDAVTVTGKASSDPDNNIASYSWKKISGSETPIISNANNDTTQISGLAEGDYQFELTVTDSAGLFSKDTVEISIIGQCLVTTTQLNPINNLSVARSGLLAVGAGSKIVFGGGETSTEASTRVDIYDVSTNLWTTAELSVPREQMTAGTVGKKIFFAGGYTGNGNISVSTRVDIYDTETGIWSTAELSEGRATIAIASAGNKILFAGGYKFDGSDRVDIYDDATNSWSTATLSQPRWGLSAVSVGNKIYFSGGEARNAGGGGFGNANIVDNIDVYDVVENTWTTTRLSEPKAYMTTAVIDGKIFFLGGMSAISVTTQNYEVSNNAEIKSLNPIQSSLKQLCSPIAGYDGVAVQKTNAVGFFGSLGFPGYIPQNKFNIYNILTNKWSVGLLPQGLVGAAIISVGNTVYVAGGKVDGVLSSQVWTLDF